MTWDEIKQAVGDGRDELGICALASAKTGLAIKIVDCEVWRLGYIGTYDAKNERAIIYFKMLSYEVSIAHGVDALEQTPDQFRDYVVDMLVEAADHVKDKEARP